MNQSRVTWRKLLLKKMESKDVRWKQRFKNYEKALAKLSEVVDRDFETMSELEIEGLIQRFEYTYELAWKTLQDFLREKGYTDIAGPTPVLEQAFQNGYIKSAEGWREMKKSRELTSHTYDEWTAMEIAKDVIESYHDLLVQLETRLKVEQLNS
jgi:nucleotidyltransferase substrate binding protein (TIGR01987 family)